jgi:hypothetical protein
MFGQCAQGGLLEGKGIGFVCERTAMAVQETEEEVCLPRMASNGPHRIQECIRHGCLDKKG